MSRLTPSIALTCSRARPSRPPCTGKYFLRSRISTSAISFRDWQAVGHPHPVLRTDLPRRGGGETILPPPLRGRPRAAAGAGGGLRGPHSALPRPSCPPPLRPPR